MSGINFAQIPLNTRVPGSYAEISNEKAVSGVIGFPTKILVFGQKTVSGTVAALDTKLITRVEDAKAFFGRGSMLAIMCESALKNQDSLEIHAIPLDDAGAGVAATGTITFGGVISESATLNLYIAGRRIRVAVLTTDTGATVATKVVAAINDNLDLPVTAVVNGVTAEQVDITAKNKGICGNDIDLRINYYNDERTPTGLTVAIVAMAGGAGNPDITALLAMIADEWYTDIAMPYTDSANLVVLEAELDERYGAMGGKDAHAYTTYIETHANIITFGDGRNSPHISTIGLPKGKIPNPSFEIAAALCAKGAFESNQDPALPFRTVVLEGILPPVSGFTNLENELFLNYGISTFEISPSSELMVGRLITNYQENALGIEDISYLDITSVKTLSHIRYDLVGFTTIRFSRKKITDDDTSIGASVNMVSVKTIQASLDARQQLWISQGWIEKMIDLQVVRDTNDPTRVNTLLAPDIVNPLHVMANKIAFRL